MSRLICPRPLVRGQDKALCVVLWSSLAYNLMHFGAKLLERMS